MRTAITPYVSVVVPVFGTTAHLHRCLSTILTQSLTEIELIVVDDGGPGDLRFVVSAICNDDPRVHVLRHPTNRGTLAARLTGAHAAKGTYIAFVDADDTINDRFVEVLYATAQQHDADLVQCAITAFELDGSRLSLNRGGDPHTAYDRSILSEFLTGKMSNSLCNKLIRTSCWRDATNRFNRRPPKLIFGEDLLILFHIASNSKRYSHISDSLYNYVRRKNSVSNNGDVLAYTKRINDLTLVYHHIFSCLESSDQPDDWKKLFRTREFSAVYSPPHDASPFLHRSTEADTPFFCFDDSKVKSVRSLRAPLDPTSYLGKRYDDMSSRHLTEHLKLCLLLPSSEGVIGNRHTNTIDVSKKLCRLARAVGHEVTLAQPTEFGVKILDGSAENSCMPSTILPRPRLMGHQSMQVSYLTYLWLCNFDFDVVISYITGGAPYYALLARNQRLDFISTFFGLIVEDTTLSQLHDEEHGEDPINKWIKTYMEERTLAHSDTAVFYNEEIEKLVNQNRWEYPESTINVDVMNDSLLQVHPGRIYRHLCAAFRAKYSVSTPELILPFNNDDLPLVSACITHYNRPFLLGQAFDSLRNQTYPRMETIIVDDGSTDPLALSVLDGISRVVGENGKVIRHEHNRYLGAARNTAALHSSGEFLFFLDDDDFSTPSQIWILVRVAITTGADIVTSFCSRFSQDSPWQAPEW